MKQIILLLTLTLTIVYAFSQSNSDKDSLMNSWVRLHPENTLTDDLMQVLIPPNSNKVYAFGDYTYVSADSGQTWISRKGQLVSGGSFNKRDFYFVSETIGYYAIRNMVFKTVDGGDSWDRVLTIPNKNISIVGPQIVGIDFLNKDTGMAVGNYGMIYKTTNGGETWITIREDNTAAPYIAFTDVRYANDSILFGIGFWKSDVYVNFAATPFSMRSKNGGKNWDYFYNFPDTLIKNNTYLRIQYVGGDTLFATLGGQNNLNTGMIAKTTNGGERWQQVNAPPSEFIPYMHWFDCRNAIVISGFETKQQSLYNTSDSGKTWNPIPLPGIHDWELVNCNFVFFKNNNGLVVGNGGYSTSILNKGETLINITPEFPDFRAIQFLDDSTGFALGRYSLYKTTNGGSNWQALGYMPAYYGVKDFHFFSEDTGIYTTYIAGLDNIHTTTDGGKTWVAQQSSNLIDYTTPYDGEYVNLGVYIIQHTTDNAGWGGKIINGNMADIAILNYQQAWGVTTRYLMFIDKGVVTDTLFTFPTGSSVASISRYSDSLAMLITDSTVFISRDNGVSWQPTSTTDSTKFGYIDGTIVNDSLLLVHGTIYSGFEKYCKQVIWRSIDKGMTWTEELYFNSTNRTFMNYSFTGNNLYVSGDNGSVYKKALQKQIPVQPTGYREIGEKKNLKIWPNPAYETAFVYSGFGDNEIVVYNISGIKQQVSISHIGESIYQIKTHQLSKGMYIIKVDDKSTYFIKR